jgi:heme A synthase
MAVAETIGTVDTATAPRLAAHVGQWFGVLAVFALAAFVLGVRNRLTAGGLFLFPPEVDWLPPLSAARWWDAYVLHQQDPAFAACGATETPEEFRVLYLREWLRRASVLMLAGTAAVGVGATIVHPHLRFVLRRIGALAALGLAYLAVVFVTGFFPRVEALARLDVGQYRHALDLTCASAALALVLVSAVRPPRPARAPVCWPAWLWAAAILMNIAIGALFSARDAAGVWTTWPFYEGGLVPPPERLVSYSPVWLNFTVNQYMIQLCHRVLSAALAIAALGWLARDVRRHADLRPALAFAFLVGLETQAGIATLAGTPAALSILHQVGAVFLLAGAFVTARSRSLS